MIAGDCRKTIPQFFRDYPGEIVSLAFFDLNAYEPTEQAFNHVYERMPSGGIVALWQLTRESVPAEGMVYAEKILSTKRHKLFKSAIYPGLCYMVKD